MNENGNLDRLAQGLSLDERKGLLEKLESQSIISREPLYLELPPQEAPGDLEARFARLPWWRRLLFFIASLFRATTPVKIFQGSEIVKAGRALEQRSPLLYNSQRGIFLPEFYQALCRLRDSSRFFYGALDAGFNRDRGAFFVFLGSLEMPEFHRRLAEETDPEKIAAKNPGMAESLIRQTALHALEEFTGSMNEDDRLKMYAHARSLHCLRQLSSFLYDRLLLAFSNDESSGGMICSSGIIRDALINLNNILYSLKEIPSMALLGSLFVFILQERENEEGFDINAETRKLLKQAETAIATIRAFNRQVPLTAICQVAARDSALVPQSLSGGEDWFMVYRDHWKQEVSDSLFRYFSLSRRRELQKMYRDFFGGAALIPLENTTAGGNPEGVELPGADSLSFLLTFVTLTFLKELDPYIRIVMAEGEFSRPEIRIEFDEAYNALIRMDEKIKTLDKSLGPEGDWGKRCAQTHAEMTSLPVKRRKIQLLMEECSEAAHALTEKGSWAINILANVCTAFSLDGKNSRQQELSQDLKFRYGSLSNIDKLSVKTPSLHDGLVTCAHKLKRAREIFAEVDLADPANAR